MNGTFSNPLARIIASACAFMVLFTATSHAQSEMLATPHIGDTFVLTPAAPSVSHPLLLDRATRVHVIVSLLFQDAAVALVSPAGERYAIGGTDTSVFRSFVSRRDLGANHHAFLTNPTPGTWRIDVSATNLMADLDVLVNAMIENGTVAVLVGGGETVPAGVSPQLALAAFDGTTRLRDLQITATAFRPDDNSFVLTFRDDGAPPDATAGDGTYSATLTTSVAGEYEVAVSVRGTASTGAFHRTANARLRAVRRTAVLDGTFTDVAVDEDQDGLYDGLIVSPRLNVIEAGTYHVSLQLRNVAGTIVQRNFHGPLPAGVVSVPVNVELEYIVRDLLEGPYDVVVVTVDHHDGGEILEVDRRIDLGQTQRYDRSRFKHYVSVGPGGPADGVDTNGNGLFDVLRIGIAVNVVEVSDHADFSATLLSPSGVELDKVPGRQRFSPGTYPLTFSFDGKKISGNGLDGPYTVSLSIRGGRLGLFAPRAFETQSLRASQFESDCDRLLIERLRATIAASVAAPGSSAAQRNKLEDVIEKLDTFVREWNKPDFVAALGELKDAAGYLEAAKMDEVVDSATEQTYLDTIVSVASRIASNGILAAQRDSSADANKLDQARHKFDEGQSLRAAGKGKDAILKFRDAVSKAQEASSARIPSC